MHDADQSSKDLGYELTDIHLRLILWSGVGLVIMTFVAFVVSVFFIKYFAAAGSMSDYEASPLAGENQEWDLDLRLQPDPARALVEHREGQSYVSASYGTAVAEQRAVAKQQLGEAPLRTEAPLPTVSEEPEIYRIPIETAMDIVAKDGLPTFTAFLPSETQEGQ